MGEEAAANESSICAGPFKLPAFGNARSEAFEHHSSPRAGVLKGVGNNAQRLFLYHEEGDIGALTGKSRVRRSARLKPLNQCCESITTHNRQGAFAALGPRLRSNLECLSSRNWLTPMLRGGGTKFRRLFAARACGPVYRTLAEFSRVNADAYLTIFRHPRAVRRTLTRGTRPFSFGTR